MEMEDLRSPFTDTFDARTLLICRKNEEIHAENDEYLRKLLPYLCITPSVTTYRICDLENIPQVQKIITKYFNELAEEHKRPLLKIETHKEIPEAVLISHWNPSELNLNKYEKEIIVDVHCAAAVLRGANIYAPGVIGMFSGTELNERVSIYADLEKQCKKGLQKLYTSPNKLFIANGIVKMVRKDLFVEKPPKGIAIQVTDTISGCPTLPSGLIAENLAILQNLPSIVCSRVLQPKTGSVILDMCAAPGNKTTHICNLIKNQGTVIAIDKTPGKVALLKEKCRRLNVDAQIFQADSTKICDENLIGKSVEKGPPFSKESFDCILLDAPCSALGKRPLLRMSINDKVLRSYVPLQRKLFENAVHLLKTGGRLVYSTCTITLAENEGIVSWALEKFSNLRLVKGEPNLGQPGLDGTNLNTKQKEYLQRFGPSTTSTNNECDSIGFFIVCFVKE